jgi:hypothetical protein
MMKNLNFRESFHENIMENLTPIPEQYHENLEKSLGIFSHIF